MSESSALRVIDVQRDVVPRALNVEQVVSNINSLIGKARESGTPVIWVQHSDDYLIKESEGWEFVPELKPAPGDIRIYKTHASSFEETDLNEELANLGTKQPGRQLTPAGHRGSHLALNIRWLSSCKD